MKVLFAVNNENISETIIKKYQQDYKQIISSKNVYYFNAIIKELQKDKSYDRIVISEDLEPFSNNNYDTIDKFIFEKMDNISDEATNLSGNDIPIILISSDRRTKSETLLVKLFGIGVYDVLLGEDRSITNVCLLLNKPRTKKEAKIYYKIEAEDVNYQSENDGDVSEVEIQNILNFYKRLGKNEEKYIESFNHIASQYTDAQLKLIAKFLPLNVKAVLEANCPKYQEIISFNNTMPNTERTRKFNNYQNTNTSKKSNTINEQNMKLDFIEKNINNNKIMDDIIIPTEINPANIKKIIEEPKEQVVETIIPKQQTIKTEQKEKNHIKNNIEEEKEEKEEKEELIEKPVKRKRGRPRKIQPEIEKEVKTTEVKRGRGRPRKVKEEIPIKESLSSDNIEQKETNEVSEEINLFELGNIEKETKENNDNDFSDMILPGLEEEIITDSKKENANAFQEQYIEPNISQVNNSINEVQTNNESINLNTFQNNTIQNSIANRKEQNVGKYQLSNIDLSPLMSREKKIVAFVGTSKNGTSFLINNLAEMLSKKGIKTALLDLTQNKNAYYIYTENEEQLRQIAYSSIERLRRGENQGIQVNKNLTVFTTLPEANGASNDYANILETLLKNYSLILLDCDFETNYGYFKEAQEIYLVQSLDILTIQPLTEFLRDLKAKNVLNSEKVRIVLNKVVKLRKVTDQLIIGGMSKYKDPSMSFMTELFNPELVQYCSVPFEEQAYSKYLEGLIDNKISLKGYSKNFMMSLSKLENMVYPLLNNNFNKNMQYNNYEVNNNFSNSMNDTLNRMKNNY